MGLLLQTVFRSPLLFIGFDCYDDFAGHQIVCLDDFKGKVFVVKGVADFGGVSSGFGEPAVDRGGRNVLILTQLEKLKELVYGDAGRNPVGVSPDGGKQLDCLVLLIPDFPNNFL